MMTKSCLIIALCAAVFILGWPLEASAACVNPAGTAGAVVYNSDVKVFQYCNDTNWIRMTKPGSGAGGCANPALAEGKLVYNADSRVLQGCAGNVYRAAGPVGGVSTNEWVKVASGSGNHSCGIKRDGSAWCWGSGGSGQLGNGSTSNSNVPVPVSGNSKWIDITVGGDMSTSTSHSCGIKIDGTAWCWGTGNNGQMGTGGFGSFSTPQAVTGGATWKAITASGVHTCGIKSDDTAWCWGSDSIGQLGNGATTGDQLSPVAVSGGGTWKAINAGGNSSAFGFTCGIKSDDTAWCWGAGNSGRLGTGGTGNQNAPAAVTGGATWKAISAGGGHACGIKSDDTAWCWGGGSNGQLGNAGTANSSNPVAVAGGHMWKAIDAGSATNCAIKSDDTLRCWGSGANGQLGNGSTANSTSPITISGGGTWSYISVGLQVACGVTTGGLMRCWGSDYYSWSQQGGLGNGNDNGENKIPTRVSGSNTWKMVSISKYSAHSCGIKSDDTAWCWGSDSNGQVGNGATTGDQNAPVAVSGGGTWKIITAGYSHSCGIKSDDTAWCWGSDGNGQVGNGATTGDQNAPVAVSGGGTWKIISTGGFFHTCGIKSDDTAWCWGSDGSGQVGNGATTGDQNAPVAVSGGGTWKAISAGGNHSCGIKSDDTAWCWGSDGSGQLGNGATTGTQDSPVAVTGGSAWKSISAGSDYSCGIKSDDTLWCWGGDGDDQLGNGAATANQPDPVAISGGGTWKSVSASGSAPFPLNGTHTCAVKADDTLWCWGTNLYGELGITGFGADAPAQVSGGGLWKSVSAGSGYSCGIASTDEIWCWGYNMNGQLGTGSSYMASAPQATWCGAPAGKEATLVYNSDFSVMQYCDGVGWVEMRQ